MKCLGKKFTGLWIVVFSCTRPYRVWGVTLSPLHTSTFTVTDSVFPLLTSTLSNPTNCTFGAPFTSADLAGFQNTKTMWVPSLGPLFLTPMTRSHVKLLQLMVERSIAWLFKIIFGRVVALEVGVNWTSMVEGPDIMKLEKVE